MGPHHLVGAKDRYTAPNCFQLFGQWKEKESEQYHSHYDIKKFYAWWICRWKKEHDSYWSSLLISTRWTLIILQDDLWAVLMGMFGKHIAKRHIWMELKYTLYFHWYTYTKDHIFWNQSRKAKPSYDALIDIPTMQNNKKFSLIVSLTGVLNGGKRQHKTVLKSPENCNIWCYIANFCYRNQMLCWIRVLHPQP